MATHLDDLPDLVLDLALSYLEWPFAVRLTSDSLAHCFRYSFFLFFVVCYVLF